MAVAWASTYSHTVVATVKSDCRPYKCVLNVFNWVWA